MPMPTVPSISRSISPGVETPPEYRRGMGIEAATAAFSAIAVVLGVWWWISPGAYPLAQPDTMSLVSGPWSTGSSLLLIVLGLLGMAAAPTMLRGIRSPWPRRLLATVAATQIGFFLGIVPDIRVLMALGYLLALAGPAALLGVLAVGAWRYPPARYVLAGLLVAGGVTSAAMGMGWDTVVQLGRQIAGGPPDWFLITLVNAGAFAGGSLWICTLARFGRRSREQSISPGRRAASWLTPERARRWGRWITVAAAMGPLPYGLTRMTWLTPWPFGFDHEALLADPAIRLFGLGLGLAAIAGSVLTLGLIRPWGEIWPRWIPVLRGRPVQARVPAALGLLVGGAVTVAGRSMVQAVLEEPTWDWTLLLIWPFPVWGPLLIAASVAYYVRRRDGRASADTSATSSEVSK